MNAVTPRSLPSALPALPTMSGAVAHALAVALNPVIGRGEFGKDDPGHRSVPPDLTAAEWDEAQRAADEFDIMLTPVTAKHLTEWLLLINLGCRNPQGPEQFAMRAAAIAELVGDLPAAAFTIETRRKVTTEFFPSAADVRAAVAPEAQAWTLQRNALRALPRPIAGPSQGPGRGSPDERAETPEQRAAHGERNRIAIQEMKDSLAERERSAGGSKLKPATLTPQQRIASYRAMGQEATANSIARAYGLETGSG